MESLLNQASNNPLVSFTLLLLVILTLPPLFERIKLPGLVGLLFAGVVLGSNGLGLLDSESESIKLLADIGKIYLMFVAGLEIDLDEFRKTKDRSLGFGFATFLLPLVFGITIGLIFGMGLNAAVLTGSLLASHTLLGYPIVNRLGVVKNEAVTVTIGATIFTDIAALLVLAICISIHGGEFSATSLIIQLVTLGIYSAIVLFGIDKLGKEYFRRTGDEESNQFMFILLVVFLAAVGAQVINVDKIVGAFLAGLAVNDVVGRSPVEEKIEFVGSTLFIPCFFVDMGLLLDIPGFIKTITTELPLTVAIVGGLFVSKWLAAAIAKLLYNYSWNQAMTMWALSLPQVAATLAAALAGLNAGLISDSVFNVVIVLMLVTSIAGPILTAKFGRKLSTPQEDLASNKTELTPSYITNPNSASLSTVANSGFLYDDIAAELTQPKAERITSYPLFRVVVPVANPKTEKYLIEMSALIANHESGLVVPLSIAKAHVHMDDPQLKKTIKRSRRRLKTALKVTAKFDVQAKPIIRIDDDIVHGISRTAREQNASLIVMGWSETNRLQSRLFGSITDSVFWSSHCSVAVVRLLKEPIDIHQILVPIKNLTPQTIRTIRFANIFAEANSATITLLHIDEHKTNTQKISELEQKLQHILDTQIKPETKITTKFLRQDNVAAAIVKEAENYDMVVLRSMRRRTAGGLAVSDISDRIVKDIQCSIVLFGESH
ncbi:Na(+)/H(+) antiporter NhaS5 [Hyella patelloides LEGE 07179]|uniref:Na(+)/H(+) antiporter NhaS5 n=1 Tax=Hyella patelloides LEGE 07179 TaxID=945734 RepID=A0A563VVI4_9CYAN|nr:cation:proton antiporter [Hyella patelloides]VEP15411.1 Na(+)/H(+) antiporter NhaS5 [Hyella patelloides LEGE 07179]